MNPNAAAAAAEAERQRQAAEAARRAEEARRAAEAAANAAKTSAATDKTQVAGSRDEFVPQASARPLVNLTGSGAEVLPAQVPPEAEPAPVQTEPAAPAQVEQAAPAAPPPFDPAPGAKAVADAFAQNGAEGAAAELRKQTENVSSDDAAALLRAAQPTIDRVTEELGKNAKKVDGDQFFPGAVLNPGQAAFDKTVTDLAAATNIAVKEGKNPDVLQAVGASITRNIDKKNIGRFDEALGNALTNGSGANLSFEVSRQLTDAGRGKQADDILENVEKGTKAFNDHMKDVGKKVEEHNQELALLIQQWGPLMTGEELAGAITKFKEGYPEYEELERLGGQMVRTAQSLKEMPENLKGMDHADDIVEANEKLVAEQFPRIDQSGEARVELEGLFRREGRGESTLLKDVPSIAKKHGDDKFLENFSTLAVQTITAQAVAGANSADPKPFEEGLEGLRKNAELFGLQPGQLDDVVAKLQQVKSVAQANPMPEAPPGGSSNFTVPPELNAALNSLRGAVDGLSGMGLFTVSNGLSKAFHGMGGLVAGAGLGISVNDAINDPNVPNVLNAINSAAGAGLTAEAALGIFRGAPPATGSAFVTRYVAGKALGAMGALISLGQGVDAGVNKDPAKAALYTAQAAGQAAIVATGLGTVSASLALTGVGIVLVVGAGWGLYQLDKVRKSNKQENKHTEDFLEGGGVTNRDITHHLRNADSEGRSVGPVLTALAKHLGMNPPDLLDKVQKLPKDKVRQFVEACHGVDPKDDGTFDVTANNDWMAGNETIVGPGGHSLDVSPHSLTGLANWAQKRGLELTTPAPAPAAG